ncbi:hypothetical protein B5G10_06880 [Barnesiella sp. An55]|nr:hypothetical protein B5G10_06880 [Barnesiella sp. An55]
MIFILRRILFYPKIGKVECSDKQKTKFSKFDYAKPNSIFCKDNEKSVKNKNRLSRFSLQ